MLLVINRSPLQDGDVVPDRYVRTDYGVFRVHADTIASLAASIIQLK